MNVDEHAASSPFLAACPQCLRPLEVHGQIWSCRACPRDFPTCANIPILTREPSRSLAASQTCVRQGLAHLHRLESGVADSSAWRTPARRSLRARLEAGINTNRALLERIASRLPNTLLFEPDSNSADGLYQTFEIIMRYAVRDWSGQRWDEEQLQTIESCIAREIPSREARGGLSIVLGAGTCRIARDLTGVLGHVLACDLSLPMLLTYRCVYETPTPFADINFQNTESAGGQVQQLLLAADRRTSSLTPQPERLSLVVADATKLPVASASAAMVFSIYFTDVVPLASFLPEVNRVLVDGGYFVHFGTLGYHRGSIADLLSVEDIRDAVESGGFRVEKEGWVSTRDIGARPDRLATVMLRNWLFVSRKISSTPAHTV